MAWGLAVDENPNGTQLGQCLIALMAITGFIDAPGGTTLAGMQVLEERDLYGMVAEACDKCTARAYELGK